MRRSGRIGEIDAPRLHPMVGGSYRGWSCDLGDGRSGEGSRLLGGDWRDWLAGSLVFEEWQGSLHRRIDWVVNL